MKGDAGRGCNALKSCLKVGGLDDKTLTQSFVRILELSQKRSRQVILPIKLGLYFFSSLFLRHPTESCYLGANFQVIRSAFLFSTRSN